MDALRKAHANGQLEGVVPLDADGNTIQEYMNQLAGSVLNQALPDLMHQIGATDRNPIMQAASGIASPLPHPFPTPSPPLLRPPFSPALPPFLQCFRPFRD